MRNSYINEYKQTVKDFYNAKMAFEAEKQSNLRKYSPEYATKNNDAIEQREASAYHNAKAKINSTFERVRGYLSCASYPSVDWFNEDRLLLENPYLDFSPAEIKALIEKHKNNFTILRIIKGWVSQHEEPEKGLLNPFADVRVNLPEDHLKIYQQFGQGALSLLDSVYSGADTEIVKLSVDAYADENFAKEMFDVIGDGLILSSYDTPEIPENARHFYDSYTLQLDTTTDSFSFKHIR